MRTTRWSVSAALVLAALVSALGLSCSGAPDSGGGAGQADSASLAAADPIVRGEYISRIGGCNDCHTPGGIFGAPDASRRLAGSEMGWQGPWGTSYGRNLTPDVETGIGSWTEEQIMVAVRTGQRPDGTRLLPPMPWPNYSALTDEDARALAKYLKSIPAVKHRSPATVPPGQSPQTPAIPIPKPGTWDAPAQLAGAPGAQAPLPRNAGGA
jgi:mono/diheme cytochrome c family protein